MKAAEPHIKRWTREEYYRMADAGLFNDKRVELIDGEVVEVSPVNHPHVLVLSKTTVVMANAFTGRYWLRSQAPLILERGSEPEPDLAIVKGAMDDYTDHPSTALLVIEVSDSTLYYDRDTKGSLYAKAGIQDYWIINLVDKQVEVYRKPEADPTRRFGFRYASITSVNAAGTLSPLALPAATIRVSDLLP